MTRTSPGKSSKASDVLAAAKVRLSLRSTLGRQIGKGTAANQNTNATPKKGNTRKAVPSVGKKGKPANNNARPPKAANNNALPPRAANNNGKKRR